MAIASFRAGEAIAAGDAVYVNANGLAYKAGGTALLQATVAGVSVDSAALGSLCRVNTDSVLTIYSGLTPGEPRYLSITNSGQLTSYSGWAAEHATVPSGAYLTSVGRAITTSGIEVEIQSPLFVLDSGS